MAIEWLEGLEARVHEATERLRALRDENRELTSRVEELEAELAEAREGDGAAAEWQREKDEIRHRVERLADGLEELIRE